MVRAFYHRPLAASRHPQFQGPHVSLLASKEDTTQRADRQSEFPIVGGVGGRHHLQGSSLDLDNESCGEGTILGDEGCLEAVPARRQVPAELGLIGDLGQRWPKGLGPQDLSENLVLRPSPELATPRVADREVEPLGARELKHYFLARST